MSTQTNARQAAELLCTAHTRKQIYDPLPDGLAPQTIDEAYQVQSEFLELLSERYGPLAGYKLAYTTPAMQKRAGLTEPCAGGLLASGIRHSPASLDSDDFLNLGVECEIAVEVGMELAPSGAPYTRGAVAQAVAAVMPAFEVVDFRTPELQGQARALTAISTNISNAGVVLGQRVDDWRGLDLASARGALWINDELAGEGHGSDIMGHPLEPLVWLANRWAERGLSISAGAIVITGSIVTPKQLRAGDVSKVWVEGLGEARLTVT
jgi:2-oxo-3-hexenedioate decarboxylase/2-keto-4-pentenoate hydratase